MQKQKCGFGRSYRLHLKQDLQIKRLMTKNNFIIVKLLNTHTQRIVP